MPDDLESLLATQSYIDGFVPSTADLRVWKSIKVDQLENRPHTSRWYRHIASFSDSERKVFANSNSTTGVNLPLSAHSVPQEATMTADVELMENLPQYLLQHLDKDHSGFNSIDLALQLNLDHQKLIGAIKSLLAQEGIISTSDVTLKRLELSSEGKEMAENGSHEFRVYEAVGADGALQADIMKQSFGKVGVSKALAAGWIAVDKSGGTVRVVRKVPSGVVDVVAAQLKDLSLGNALDDKVKADLKKRKLITETVVKGLEVTKGPQFSTELSKPELDLTPEMIATGEWKTKSFKKYNFEALGVQPPCGHLHPLMKVRAEFRNIFFSMGFSEMPTNRYVESSFWNFDALFQPQQHPARDAHDTFFVSEPALSTEFPADYLEKVKTVHAKGGFGSIGYNYDWKLEEAQKNLLRTHTTAVSARELYKLAQEKEFKPTRMFSIDRVFRNETLDATHLAEFHQVEGVIAERNLSLAHLIGVFTEFFKKLGLDELRFKPAYNPYTEPSMEIFAYHKGLGKWVEIGNSGMFRPEMLLPMGLPADVNVAGYGLSLERPTMIRYGIDNIRDMFGPKIDIGMVYNGPICRMDKK